MLTACRRQFGGLKTMAAVKKQMRRSLRPSSSRGESMMSGGGNSSLGGISQWCSREVDESFSSKISSLTNGSCKPHDRRDRRSCLLTAYAELHCHSAFSFLKGASPPGEILAEAHRLGYPALAPTDRNGIY